MDRATLQRHAASAAILLLFLGGNTATQKNKSPIPWDAAPANVNAVTAHGLPAPADVNLAQLTEVTGCHERASAPGCALLAEFAKATRAELGNRDERWEGEKVPLSPGGAKQPLSVAVRAGSPADGKSPWQEAVVVDAALAVAGGPWQAIVRTAGTSLALTAPTSTPPAPALYARQAGARLLLLHYRAGAHDGWVADLHRVP